MTAVNDITGDAIQTKSVSNAYRDNWDHIFGKNKRESASEVTECPSHDEDSQQDNEQE